MVKQVHFNPIGYGTPAVVDSNPINALMVENARLRAVFYDIIGSSTDKQTVELARRALEPKP